MVNPRARSKAICASMSMAGLVNDIRRFVHKKTRRGALESEAWRVLLGEVYAALKGEVKLNYLADSRMFFCWH
jgi:hypothetical protein